MPLLAASSHGPLNLPVLALAVTVVVVCRLGAWWLRRFVREPEQTKYDDLDDLEK